GWAQRDDGELVYKLLADVGVEARAAIEAELDRLARRLDGGDDGPHLFKVRFSSPLNRELRR
ncbi:MAG: winged helix DNA-binding domain-containing protein, partial [Acidimicrobiia bacterium]|nr:winged helix DNA-binding domain-containing protein [Acidimicrobiia bacterium]